MRSLGQGSTDVHVVRRRDKGHLAFSFCRLSPAPPHPTPPPPRSHLAPPAPNSLPPRSHLLPAVPSSAAGRALPGAWEHAPKSANPPLHGESLGLGARAQPPQTSASRRFSSWFAEPLRFQLPQPPHRDERSSLGSLRSTSANLRIATERSWGLGTPALQPPQPRIATSALVWGPALPNENSHDESGALG